MPALAIVEVLLFVSLGSFICYLAFLSVCALFTGTRTIPPGSRSRSFAIVVPAHNEQEVLGATLLSLQAIEYPKRLVEIIVVADNCSDGTQRIAESFGATVLKRVDRQNIGKGFALRWAFDRVVLSERPADAVVVVDADSSVSSNILTVLDSYLAHGARAIQIADVVQPNNRSWNTEIIRLGFTLYNVVRPLGKKVLGLSVGLRGNGMCFTANLLRKIPWNAYSLAEDLEYGLTLLLAGEKVVFAPEATIVATMPEKSSQSITQRARWEVGRFPVVRKYFTELLKNTVVSGSVSSLDSLMDLVAPPFVNLSTLVFGALVLHVSLIVLGVGGLTIYCLGWFVLSCLAIVHVLFGLVAAKADKSLYKAISHVPRYALWKLHLYLRLIYSAKTVLWVRTARSDQSLRSESRKKFTHQYTQQEKVRS